MKVIEVHRDIRPEKVKKPAEQIASIQGCSTRQLRRFWIYRGHRGVIRK